MPAMRRAKGEGSITRRADGRWMARYYGSDGKRRALYAASRQAVLADLRRTLRDKELGVYVAGPSQTLEQFLATWLREAATRLKPRSVQRYESIVRLQIVPALGAVQLRKVTPQMLIELYASLHLAPATIGQVHIVLHAALDTALRWQLVARNPAAAVRAPRSQPQPMTVLSPDQARQIIAATDGTEIGTLYRLALNTGLRQGELLALRWRDVDIETGQLEVNATLVRMRGVVARGAPKRPSSRRTVIISDAVREALIRHRRLQAERHLALGHRPDPDTLLFTDRWGAALNGFHLTEREFKPLLRRLGLPMVRFHDLRHAFASLMLSQGVRVDLVSQMLGHAKPAITLNVYAHLLPGDQQEAVRRLDAVLGGR